MSGFTKEHLDAMVAGVRVVRQAAIRDSLIETACDHVEALVEEVNRLTELFGKRFHTDTVCGSCGGPLDVERDAICVRCTDAALVNRLPKTADGVIVIPGQDTAWFDSDGIREGVVVAIGLHDCSIDLQYNRTSGELVTRAPGIEQCYSTREAAEKARGQ